MSAHHCAHDCPAPEQITNLPRYRRVLWVALFVNATMFLIELGAGFSSGSLSLLADAIDFAGDALNYGVSLAVLASALAWRARAAMFKAFSMMGFGLYVLGSALWSVWNGSVPDAPIMGVVALLALLANVSVAWLLYAFREGDANMRSVWLCSRNDAIGNVAVFLAALGVLGTGSAWPDLLVAALMAGLALHGGWQVLRQARGELGAEAPPKAMVTTMYTTTMPTEPMASMAFDPDTFERLHRAYLRVDRSDLDQAWHLLEALHVLGQTRLVPHVRAHGLMLALAWRTRDLAEVNGQLLRLLLVPLGHLLGRLPLGNTGRSNVDAFRPISVAPELLATIRAHQRTSTP